MPTVSHAFTCYVACDALRTDGSPAIGSGPTSSISHGTASVIRAGEFVLADSRRLRYLGHQGAAYLELKRPDPVRNDLSIPLGDHLRGSGALPVPLSVDGRLHRVTRRPVTDRMVDGYVRVDDPKARSCYRDDGSIDATAAEARKVVAREAVVSEDRVLVRKPPPVWQSVPLRPGILLKQPSDCRSEVNGMDEFAADRLAAAVAYCALMGHGTGHEREQFGRVEYLDPEFVRTDDLVAVAARAGSFVASELRPDLPGMPGAMVARWHEVAQASASLKSGDTWRAGEILRSVADLIGYAEDPGNDCVLRHDFKWFDSRCRWQALRKRVFEIEGIEPRLLIEEQVGIAPAGSRS